MVTGSVVLAAFASEEWKENSISKPLSVATWLGSLACDKRGCSQARRSVLRLFSVCMSPFPPTLHLQLILLTRTQPTRQGDFNEETHGRHPQIRRIQGVRRLGPRAAECLSSVQEKRHLQGPASRTVLSRTRLCCEFRQRRPAAAAFRHDARFASRWGMARIRSWDIHRQRSYE